jgi:hypothetical protein
MIILGFDSATKNLGICCVEVNDNWRDDAQCVIDSCNELYSNLDKLDATQLVGEIESILLMANELVSNMVKIRYYQVINLIADLNLTNETTTLERVKRLKSLLYSLDEDLDKRQIRPTHVLIEYQMIQNDISRTISNCIAYHYMDLITFTVGSSQNKSAAITYAVDDFKINKLIPHDDPVKMIVELVGTTLKNKYSFCPEGEYSNFIMKYSNYEANKKHTDFNFKYFLETFGYAKINIKNKTNDIADGFMMIFGWLKKNEII